MADGYPSNLPDVLTVGDSIDFTDSLPDYPVSGGWSMSYVLVPRFTTPTQAPITLAATGSGTDYRIQATAATTAAWTAGIYAWNWYATATGKRVTLGSGTTTLAPDPAAQVQGYDSRTTAEKALADALSAYATFSSSGGRVKRYHIGDREMEFDAAADIIKTVDFWKGEVLREHATKAVRDGLPNPRRIELRMTNA